MQNTTSITPLEGGVIKSNTLVQILDGHRISVYRRGKPRYYDLNYMRYERRVLFSKILTNPAWITSVEMDDEHDPSSVVICLSA